jgi:cold shock CspA family protein
MKTGKIRNFNTHKGFGFIRESLTNDEIFFHVTDCVGFIPEVGIEVRFEVGRDKLNRVKAINISNKTDKTSNTSGRAEVTNWNKQ